MDRQPPKPVCKTFMRTLRQGPTSRRLVEKTGEAWMEPAKTSADDSGQPDPAVRAPLGLCAVLDEPLELRQLLLEEIVFAPMGYDLSELRFRRAGLISSQAVDRHRVGALPERGHDALRTPPVRLEPVGQSRMAALRVVHGAEVWLGLTPQ